MVNSKPLCRKLLGSYKIIIRFSIGRILLALKLSGKSSFEIGAYICQKQKILRMIYRGTWEIILSYF